jgi:GT2 family glycosyltransferase
MLIKKDVIEKNRKGWDENIYTYHEDIDLCFRFRLAGFQIIKVSESIAYHVGFASHSKEKS